MIGTTKPDSVATVEAMIADAQQGQSVSEINASLEAIPSLLAQKGTRYITSADWQPIDQKEVAAGKTRGKPREKFTTIPELLTAAGK